MLIILQVEMILATNKLGDQEKEVRDMKQR